MPTFEPSTRWLINHPIEGIMKHDCFHMNRNEKRTVSPVNPLKVVWVTTPAVSCWVISVSKVSMRISC